MEEIEKPEISSRFDVDDIRKIRNYNSARHAKMTCQEVVDEYRNGTEELIKKYGLKVTYAPRLEQRSKPMSIITEYDEAKTMALFRKEGYEEAQIEIATNMLRLQFPRPDIMRICSIPEDKVREIAKGEGIVLK